MLTANRKNHLSEFSLKIKLPTALLLALLFCLGFWISLEMRWMGAPLYLLLWIGSYGVIYAGACRDCVYYGKSCPIPMEGSCVHRFFSPRRGRFGVASLLWATFAYVMRVFLPLLIVVRKRLVVIGLAYVGVLTLFWIVHLYLTGCPNCVNFRCPLNSGTKKPE